MISHFTRTFSALLIVLSFALLPITALAADEETRGTVRISMSDENNLDFEGYWNLYRGQSNKTTAVRSGTGSDTFKVGPGFYFLEVFNKLPDHRYHWTSTENPQEVVVGEMTTYRVKYFTTEEAYNTAAGIEVEPSARVQTTSSISTYNGDIIDENGCNRTDGYVWCDRTEKCTIPWTKACVVSEPEEVVEAPKPVVPPAPIQVMSDAELAERTYMGARTTSANTQNTATGSDSAASSSGEFQLAETGPANLLLLLVPSILSGLYFVRRKKS